MYKWPLIALMTSLDCEGRVCVKQEYLRALYEHCAIGATVAYEDSPKRISEMCKRFDGFMFCGGGDISPQYYGEATSKSTNMCSERDDFEFMMLGEIIKTQKPILGICRGAQVINVFFGGSLNQHIDYHMLDKNDGPVEHEIEIMEGSSLSRFVDKSTNYVNSFHHQSVKDIGRCLVVDATCDGCIEAFHHKDYPFCWGIQWHPEKCANEEMNAGIFESFVKATIGKQVD